MNPQPDLTALSKRSVLDGFKPKQALWLYWKRLTAVVSEQQATHICQTAAEAIREHPTPQHELAALQSHWYRTLDDDAPDYGVYRIPIYLAEVWYCWSVYSRKYLSEIAKLRLLDDARSIVDLGCGSGYSTAALCQIASSARVLGTNVLDGAQGAFCRTMAEHYGFELREHVAAVGPVDVVFASEYFEHFPAPLEHLHEVLEHCQPRMLIVANTFTSPSIGHFRRYRVDGTMLDGSAASRAFNAALQRAGYTRQKLSLWNNRPGVWKR